MIPIGAKNSFTPGVYPALESHKRDPGGLSEPVELRSKFRKEWKRGLGLTEVDQGRAVVLEPVAVGLLAAFVEPPDLGQLVGGVDSRDAAVAGNPAAVLGLALAIGRDRRVLGHLPDQVRHLVPEF